MSTVLNLPVQTVFPGFYLVVPLERWVNHRLVVGHVEDALLAGGPVAVEAGVLLLRHSNCVSSQNRGSL
jgi:hypothetical protein